MITQKTINEIYETAKIEDIVGDFVNLKRAGVTLKGLCPFHNEKSPSFTVSPSKGIYKCFGCGKGGNAVNFVMEHEQYTYPEALRYVAKRYNIEIQEEERTPQDDTAQKEKEAAKIALNLAANFFNENLSKSKGNDYVLKRKFTPETVLKFKIGFASKLELQGVKTEILHKVGLIYENGNDFFYNRLVFPIFNLYGDVIGFTGRSLEDNPKVKYKNSPDSDFYNKSKVLYGLNFAKNEIVKSGFVFVVEGQTDVISLHQAGVQNVVASSGTALTESHLTLLKRFTSHICLVFDGDAAGIKASIKAIEMALKLDFEVLLLNLPNGNDPDSFINNHGSDVWNEYASKNKVSFVQFMIDTSKKEIEKDATKKAGLIKKIISYINLVPDTIKQDIYITQISESLNVSKNVLVDSLSGSSAINEAIKENTKAVTSNERTKRDIAEIEMFAFLVENCEMVLSDGVTPLFNSVFETINECNIYAEISSEYLPLMNLFEEKQSVKITDLFSLPIELNGFVANVLSRQDLYRFATITKDNESIGIERTSDNELIFAAKKVVNVFYFYVLSELKNQLIERICNNLSKPNDGRVLAILNKAIQKIQKEFNFSEF